MSEWKTYKLNELGEILDSRRVPIKSIERSKIQGQYPYYGASGIIDYIDKYIFDGQHVLIAEDGENLISKKTPIAFIVSGMFWVNNHAHIFKGKNVYIDTLVVYTLLNLDINEYITGAAQPKLSQSALLSIPFYFPESEIEQKAIASILINLDNKIDILNRQNTTLEKMAETLFRQWFIVEEKEEWEDGYLGDAITFYDKQRVPLSNLQRNNMKTGKLYPYYGAAKIMDYINKYIFDGDYILIAEDGSVQDLNGYPVIQRATGKFWVNNHAHIIKGKYPYYDNFIYILLLKRNIEEAVTGAVQPKISQENLSKLPIKKYPRELLAKFNSCTSEIFNKISLNNKQISTLDNLRNTLLPKLMSGEIRVKCDEKAP